MRKALEREARLPDTPGGSRSSRSGTAGRPPAIDAKYSTGADGRVTLSRGDIAAVTSAAQLVPDRRVNGVRAGVRMGFTVIGAGLLLLALTLIPQDVHGLMTRAVSAILIVGALMVGAAVANGNWLKGVDRLGNDGRASRD